MAWGMTWGHILGSCVELRGRLRKVKEIACNLYAGITVDASEQHEVLEQLDRAIEAMTMAENHLDQIVKR